MRPIWAICNRQLRIAPAYDQQIWFSIKQQVVLAVLAALVLDMGRNRPWNGRGDDWLLDRRPDYRDAPAIVAV